MVVLFDVSRCGDDGEAVVRGGECGCCDAVARPTKIQLHSIVFMVQNPAQLAAIVQAQGGMLSNVFSVRLGFQISNLRSIARI